MIIKLKGDCKAQLVTAATETTCYMPLLSCEEQEERKDEEEEDDDEDELY